MKSQKIYFYLLSLVLIAVLFVSLLPSFLSSNIGKEIVVSALNKSIPGKIEIKTLQATWLGPQKLEGVQLLTPSGEVVASFEAISLDSALWNLFKKHTLFKGSLSNLQAHLKPEENGEMNLGYSLGKTIVLPLSSPLLLTEVESSFKRSSDGVLLSGSGKTNQGDLLGHFTFAFEQNQKGISVEADVQKFPVDLIDAIASTFDTQFAGLFKTLFGNTLDVGIRQSENGYSFTAHSPSFQWDMEGKLEDGRWLIQKPGKMFFTLSPEALRKGSFLFGLSPQQFTSVDPVNLEFQWAEMAVPIDFFIPEQKISANHESYCDFVLTVPKISFINQEGESFALEGFNVALKASQDSSSLEMHVQGVFKLNSAAFPFSLTMDMPKPVNVKDLETAFVQPNQLHLSLDKANSSGLDAILGTSETFFNLLGSKFTFHLHSSKDDPDTLAIQLRSDELRIPEAILKVHQQFHLDESWEQSEVSGEFFAEKIIWKEPFPKDPANRANIVAQEVKIPWKIRPQSKEAQFSVRGIFENSTRSPKPFSGEFSANLDQRNVPLFKANFKGEEIPSELLEWLTRKNYWKGLFGSTMQLDFSAELKGSTFNKGTKGLEWEKSPVALNIKGDAGALHLNGKLEQSFFTLLDPLIWRATPSESLGKDVLGELIPAFKSLIHGDRPIQLTIQPKNFSFPLNLSWDELLIGEAKLDLGILNFRNSPSFKQLLQLLKEEKRDSLSFWTTPLYFNINKGVLELFRTDTLVLNRYPLALWGKIDWPQDRVNMILGVSGQALVGSYPLGMKSGEMLQIPVSGSLAHTKVDSGHVTRKIGSLLAKNSGIKEGALLGIFLDLAGGKEGKIPPPTTYPFPWDDPSNKQAFQDNSPRSEQRVEPSQKDILKKGASKILKSLLK